MTASANNQTQGSGTKPSYSSQKTTGNLISRFEIYDNENRSLDWYMGTAECIAGISFADFVVDSLFQLRLGQVITDLDEHGFCSREHITVAVVMGV